MSVMLLRDWANTLGSNSKPVRMRRPGRLRSVEAFAVMKL
jgi:hypothetical protein